MENVPIFGLVYWSCFPTASACNFDYADYRASQTLRSAYLMHGVPEVSTCPGLFVRSDEESLAYCIDGTEHYRGENCPSLES